MSNPARADAMQAQPATNKLLAWLLALRPHQWLKNLLLLVPLLAAHQLADREALLAAMLGIAAFCLCASSGYLINDLLDRNADRAHPRKRNRPYASGALPAWTGLVGAVALLLGAVILAAALPREFWLIIAGYIVATLGYSLLAKRIVMLDVLVLAGLYVLRILAGGAASGIPISFWLLAFSLFLFLGLAMVKRYIELIDLQANGGSLVIGRGYAIEDLPVIQAVGIGSSLLSVLVLALYIDSATGTMMYGDPRWLWLLCPTLLYLIGRTWVHAHRGLLHDDPLVAFARDPVVWLIAALSAAVLWLAS